MTASPLLIVVLAAIAPSVLTAIVALMGFGLGGLLCLVLAVAEWGAWTLVAPRRKWPQGHSDLPGGNPLAGEPIEAVTVDGVRLAGMWYPATGVPRTDRTLLLMHGFAEDPLGFRARAEAMAQRGWNAASIDLRGHGRSEGEHTSFGGREADDLHAWIDGLAERVGPGMVLAVWGRSMGAAVALRAAAVAAPGRDASRITTLILEAPYLDLEEAIAILLRRFRLPFPRLLARVVARRAEALAGVSLHRPRPIDLAPRVTAPVLILHGSDDTLVPLADAQRLAQAFPAPASLVEIAGGHHTDLLDVGGPGVIDRVSAFLDGLKS